jgi:YggT family protein
MTGAALNTGSFLVSIIFSLYLAAVMLRFLLQWVKADFYNPICQFLMKATNPPLVPLRRIIPGFFGLDIAAVFLMFVIQVGEIALLSWMNDFQITYFIILLAIKDLFLLLIKVYIYAIIIQAISSWFSQPGSYNPMSVVLYQLTEPVLRPFRKYIPPMGGMDFSSLVAIILLYAVSIFISGIVI